jgi:succinate dehydrogenase/fumarate reductase-like Fe-S protein
MKVKVLRSMPEKHFEEYNVPLPTDREYTIMDILRYISENLDPTLAYFSHSACKQGICGRCSVKYNGKIVLACAAHADSEELILEPKNDKVIKDLVCW